MLTYSNMAMEQGGFAVGRSAPVPAVGEAFLSETVPSDAYTGMLIDNAVRIKYHIFF